MRVTPSNTGATGAAIAGTIDFFSELALEEREDLSVEL